MMSRVAMSMSRSLMVSRATWTTASIASRFYSAHKKPYSDKVSQIRDFRQSDREYGAVKPRVPNKADKVHKQEDDEEAEFDFDPKSPEFKSFIESLTPEQRQEVLKDIEELNKEPESPFNKTKDFDLLRHYSAERKPHFRPEKFYGEEHASLVAGDREPTPSEREAASRFEVNYGKVAGFIDHGRFTVGTIIRVRSHTNVTAGGRVNSYSAITVVGDQKGTVGIGYGKSPIYSQCEPNAHADALKKLVAFDIVKGSVSHPIKYKYKSTIIYLWPRPPGYGIVASPLAFTIFSAAGITDITCKIHGSRNVLNVARGIVEALKYSEDPRTTALKLGIKYEDKSALYSPYGQTSYY